MIKKLEEIIEDQKFLHWNELGDDIEPIHDKEWYECLCWITEQIKILKKEI